MIEHWHPVPPFDKCRPPIRAHLSRGPIRGGENHALRQGFGPPCGPLPHARRTAHTAYRHSRHGVPHGRPCGGAGLRQSGGGGGVCSDERGQVPQPCPSDEAPAWGMWPRRSSRRRRAGAACGVSATSHIGIHPHPRPAERAKQARSKWRRQLTRPADRAGQLSARG